MHTRQSQQQTKDTSAVSQTHAATNQQMPEPLSRTAHPTVLIQRDIANPGSLNQAEVAQLHRTIGNQAVGRLLRVQPKLTVGQVGDHYEQEADRVATQVVKEMGAPVSSAVQRQTVEEQDKIQRRPSVQQQTTESGTAVTSDIEAACQQARGSGQSLPATIRRPMEQAFEADFSGVRIHTDRQADKLNHSLQARALTTGQDVFFRQGAYDPQSQNGQELLAHELTHVVQQGAGGKNWNSAISQLPTRYIQAQWDYNNPNFANTQKIDPLKDDFLVLKFTDNGNDECIIKGEVVAPTTALENLTGEVASWVMPLKQALKVKNVTAHWNAIQQAITQHMGPNAQSAISALAKAVQTGHLSMMSVAKGEVTKALAKRPQEMMSLMAKPSYLEDLGRLTALDVYLCQADRVLSGNIGNWMSSLTAHRVSALIDNTDRQSNVDYFLGTMTADTLRTISNGQVTDQTPAAQAKNWALNEAVRFIFIAFRNEGIFSNAQEINDYLQKTSKDLTKNFQQYYVDHMSKGWDDAVKKLTTKARQQGWQQNIKDRILSGESTVPQYLLARVQLRNRYFLGV